MRDGGRSRSAAALAALFWVATVSLMAFALVRERNQAIVHARQQAETLSAVVEESTARTFENVDSALMGIAAYLSVRDFPANDASVRETMQLRLQHLPTVRALFVIGPDGWIRHDTDFPKTPHVSLADRDYFRQYLADPNLQHDLSQAILSRSGTGWFVASTRRLVGKDGGFQGVVVAAVQLDWFSQLFTRLHLERGQTLSLLQGDGRLLARYPRDDQLVGRDYSEQRVFARGIPKSRTGVFEAGGSPLGYPRIVSYRALDTQPLVVVLTMPMENVLATWYRTATGALAALVVLTALTAVGLLFFVQREEESRRAVVDRIARTEAQASAEANARFRTFFEQGSCFSCVLSLDGTVIQANRAGLEASGIVPEQVIGRKFWDCPWWGAAGGQAETVQQGVASAAAGATLHTEAAYWLGDGARTLVELVFSPIRDTTGNVLSVATIAVDITERKHQEEKLRALADEVSKADRLKGEFLATLSHELRNVLAPLQNGMAILGRVAPGADVGLRTQEVMNKQLSYMRRLVDDLLDMSRLNNGKVRVVMEQIDLRELLSTVADAAQSIMQAASHSFTTALGAEDLPALVDRTRMHQVLTNLLANAAKYTPPGGHIQLNARREGSEIVVEVVDDGMGIPLEAQTRVFEMFQQVPENLGRAQGGLGIGLALVQKLVLLQGGHVEAFSAGPGLGSTFTVYLPLAQSKPDPDGTPIGGAQRANGTASPDLQQG
jgi:PAS domain S-box-containing protein